MNDSSILTKPSYYALTITGIMLLVIIVISFRNFSALKRENIHNLILLVSSIGILIGIHGILHLGLEQAYGYNPIKKVMNVFNI